MVDLGFEVEGFCGLVAGALGWRVGRGAPLQREMITGPGFRSLDQPSNAGSSLCNVPDQGRIRAGTPFVLPSSVTGRSHLGRSAEKSRFQFGRANKARRV